MSNKFPEEEYVLVGAICWLNGWSNDGTFES